MVGVGKREEYVTECAEDEGIYTYMVQIRHGTISEDQAMSVLNEPTDIANVYDSITISRC